ncbi:DUF2285 domain-containing protein [Sphingopyxis sp. GW247-27LB]|uniref:DNA -binding domain-containing protein n=1 Tax=Sphingopyxis sp. GW247-27LB TaxID=2012632 RepID=UPI001140D894|nr:DUF2285 domain-containing protein [Sphingopyxis sp. GW247-27LB]
MKGLDGDPGPAPQVPDWLLASEYAPLLFADRRSFAWEWLRRSAPYRAAWRDREVGEIVPSDFGLMRLEDPDLATPYARPIWTPALDPRVLRSKAADHQPASESNLLDIRDLADYVSVAVDETNAEHWLLSDGHWVIRLDLHDGTLLGGPLFLDYQIGGLVDTGPKISALQQLVALATGGELPTSLKPRETRAPRWILELRTADAIAAGAAQQEIAQAFFGSAVAPERWRKESSPYRSRVQRLVKAAQRRLADPLCGPWFS